MRPSGPTAADACFAGRPDATCLVAPAGREAVLIGRRGLSVVARSVRLRGACSKAACGWVRGVRSVKRGEVRMLALAGVGGVLAAFPPGVWASSAGQLYVFGDNPL